MASTARSTGVVVFFNDLKGFGFIRIDKGVDEYFVHRSSITNVDSNGVTTLRENDVVEFTIQPGKGDKKSIAVDVTITVPNTTLPEFRSVNLKNCYNCGKRGHLSRNCNADYKGGPAGDCLNCGGFGHVARECRKMTEDGFIYIGKADDNNCHNCGGYGHFVMSCYNCGGNLCRGKRASRVQVECFNCGERGHRMKDCRNPKKAS